MDRLVIFCYNGSNRVISRKRSHFEYLGGIFMVVTWILSLVAAVGALVYVFMNYRRIKAMPEGTDEMVEMSGIIRSGSNTFMLTEYRSITTR